MAAVIYIVSLAVLLYCVLILYMFVFYIVIIGANKRLWWTVTDEVRCQVLWLSICDGSSMRWAMRASRRWFWWPITLNSVASACITVPVNIHIRTHTRTLLRLVFSYHDKPVWQLQPKVAQTAPTNSTTCLVWIYLDAQDMRLGLYI